MLIAKVPPFVPTPAPALISPVGFSSISISLIFIIYLFNDTKDYKWLISGSLDRVIFQASGFLIIFVSETLNSVIKRFKY